MISRILFLMVLALGSGTALAQNLTVYSSGNVTRGGSRQLSAYVPLSPNTIVWSVNGVPGGDATYGTVSPGGLYQAPAAIPADNVVSVRATSTAYPDKWAAVALTIVQPQVNLWSLSPGTVPAGNFEISLNGSNFHAGSVAQADGVPLTTTYVSATRLKASGTLTAAQAGTTVKITVVNTGLGSTTSGAVNLAVTAPVVVPVVVTVSPATVALNTGMTQTFTAGVTGTAHTAVTWTVNDLAGGNPVVGTVSAAGVYTAPATVPNPATVTVRARSVADPAVSAAATVTLVAAPPAADLAAGRFLEQAAYGPTAAEIAKVKTGGIDTWLDEQFALPETPIANPGGMAMSAVQAQYLHRLATAPDQLRQRVAGALGQIVVISANKNMYPDQLVPYLRMLSAHAFGNYRALLEAIARSAQMGKYLDLANSNAPTAGSAANENFARELLQLFTIGLYALNPDGSVQVDTQGLPVRAYDQFTVQQVALALTGWTFPGPANNNWEDFSGPLQPREANHATGAKVLPGLTIPAGQTVEADLASVLDWCFHHPNTGPFVATRLIRALVKSNPAPDYIARIAGVFADDGTGQRGNLRAVVRAILKDAEARNDVPAATDGRLKDAIYHVVAFVRALGGSISPTNQQAWPFSRMSQTPLAPPSVFGFYSPLYRVPRSTLVGPEFQIYGPTEAVLRGNMFWQILANPGADFAVNIGPYVNLAGDTAALIDAVDRTLLYGRMPAAMKQSLANAIDAQGDATSKARTALHLTALSGLYAVQF